MTHSDPNLQKTLATYYVDEAGDGVLFGPMGRNRLDDPDAPRFFMLGMVRCTVDSDAENTLRQLREALQANPLYASIPSMQTVEGKTARAFHAKDDHPEVRAKVFEALLNIDFKFFAVIKDMRAVLKYVEGRNRMNGTYRYHPNELYDLSVRMLFKNKLHTQDRYTIARRGKSDRTKALRDQLEVARIAFLNTVPANFGIRNRNHSGISLGKSLPADSRLLCVGTSAMLRTPGGEISKCNLEQSVFGA